MYFPVSVDHSDVALRCGFGLFQEKEGFLWTDTGQVLPDRAGLTVRSLAGSRSGR